jgi:hypothetical protein
MSPNRLLELRALQRPDGSFESIITSRRGRIVDFNGFVSALILRLLRHLPDSPALSDIRRRALDWIWNCHSQRVSGAFSFWPEGMRPGLARKLPPDVDDTAVMLLELLRHGRLDRADVLRSLCKVILPCRVSDKDVVVMPPWVVSGSFFTWITHTASDPTSKKVLVNIVDCCVNANVVALMSQIDARHLPGYRSAVQTVLNGLQWSAGDEKRLASLTPFYPSPGNLADAMELAVECGVHEFRAGLRQLMSLPADILNMNTDLCRSGYGKISWKSPAVDLARLIAQSSS